MSAPNTDYDAAQALLDLQGNINPGNAEGYVRRGSHYGENMENTAKLFWNCFISSDIPRLPKISYVESQSNIILPSKYTTKPHEHFNKRIKHGEIHNDGILRTNNHCDRNTIKYAGERNTNTLENTRLLKLEQNTNKNSNFRNTIRNKVDTTKTSTREIETQTEECYFNPNIELLENTIKKLYERIQSLEAQLKESDMSGENSGFVKLENNANVSCESQNYDEDNMSFNESYVSQYSENDDHDTNTDTNYQKKDNYLHNRVLMNHNIYPNSKDMVPIGDGHASVPARILKHINWNSYTSATRKLLTAVFSRRILATHSLTGKPSPAFPNKPAKKKLDSSLVNDIVQTVVERCSVPENVVRTSITTKCADESKMLRTRQNNKTRSGKKNRENISPTTSESESDVQININSSKRRISQYRLKMP